MAELIIDAKVENLAKVNDFVHEAISNLDISMKTLMQLNVVVEEIFVNIAEYAYFPTVDSVKFVPEIDPETRTLALTFTDSGKVYNPSAKSDSNIDLPIEERKIGGTGIFMIKKLVDKISCSVDSENVLRIEKNFICGFNIIFYSAATAG